MPNCYKKNLVYYTDVFYCDCKTLRRAQEVCGPSLIHPKSYLFGDLPINPPCPVTAERHHEVSLHFQQVSRPWPQDPEILDNGRKAAEAGPQLKGKMPVLPLHKPDLQHEADGFLNHYFGTQRTTSGSKSFHFKWPIRSSLQQRALAKKRKSLDYTLKRAFFFLGPDASHFGVAPKSFSNLA